MEAAEAPADAIAQVCRAAAIVAAATVMEEERWMRRRAEMGVQEEQRRIAAAAAALAAEAEVDEDWTANVEPDAEVEACGGPLGLRQLAGSRLLAGGTGAR